MIATITDARIGLVILLALAVFLWRQSSARKRFVATIKTLAESGREEIGGHSVEDCLDILNQDTAQTLTATDKMVLTYKGHELFLVDGEIAYVTTGRKSTSSCTVAKRCFLVATGQSAVRLLSEQEKLFGLITGSSELAAFSIRRCSAFIAVLTTEKKPARVRETRRHF